MSGPNDDDDGSLAPLIGRDDQIGTAATHSREAQVEVEAKVDQFNKMIFGLLFGSVILEIENAGGMSLIPRMLK